MTNHMTEGSHKTFTKIWREAEDQRLTKMEEKAERRARKAGVEEAHIRTTLLSDRLRLQGRGWKLESTTSVGIATVSRYELTRTLT